MLRAMRAIPMRHFRKVDRGQSEIPIAGRSIG